MTLARTSAASPGSGAGGAPAGGPAWPPGVRTSSSRALRQGGGRAGAQPPGGAAGSAQPGAGDRAGEDLDDGVLPGGQAAAGGGEGPQRIAAVIGFERQDLGAGQPQRPPGRQRPGRERRAWRGR